MRMQHSLLILMVGGLMLSGCTDGGDSESPVVTTTQTSPQAEPETEPPSPSPSPELQGWTPEQEERAAQIFANGIKRKYALELRLEAGRCTVDKLKQFYDTFDEWIAFSVSAPGGQPRNEHEFLRELKLLGDCELKVGI